ncbi:low-density lipoprotein receptor-related protein 4-like [Panonychus citri]|uniref:low-density lipoprotein receptor-related protein 4-like n=1 Tax=Panonychus citri TaxID=50023 RepID=UPI002306FE98|nr:low-density lipoprotein receptor-related protein 4-like [Panonychus citri]
MKFFYMKLCLYYYHLFYYYYTFTCYHVFGSQIQPEPNTMVDDAKFSESRPCASSEFRCHKGGCISLQWHCDSDIDCKDGSDELDCDQVPMDHVTCPIGKYRCRNGRCIAEAYHCDGDNDCGDWSDEDKCESKVECQSGEFTCSNGGCINQEWKCDGDKDCDDGSDEKDCPSRSCTEDQFRCHSGRCIRASWRCDGDADCSDNSDEKGCGYRTECLTGQFKCDDGTCISQYFVCNGAPNCPDGSDEDVNKTCLSSTPCRDDGFPCQHLCLASDSGHHCGCKKGYELASDGHSCLDIDECFSHQLSCSQRCENNVPGFQCFCTEGYTMSEDKISCKANGPEPYIIFANRVDIRRVTLDASDYTAMVSDLQNVIALDFHYARQLIVWSDITTDTIYIAHLNGSSQRAIISSGLVSPGGLAVDWSSDRLYWTDSGTGRIEFANLIDGSMRKVLFWRNIEKPRAIVVNLEESSLYWIDWGSPPRIETAHFDGSGRESIVYTSLFWPNGLTIDYPASRLYWTDAKHHLIECSKLDGSDRRSIIQGETALPHPFAITVFEDIIYWTDWRTKSINSAHKLTGKDITTVHGQLHSPMDLLIVHPLRQAKVFDKCFPSSPSSLSLPSAASSSSSTSSFSSLQGSSSSSSSSSSLSPSHCSHICLANNVTFTCACPTGFSLSPDGSTCNSKPETFLLFTRRNDIRWLCLDCPDEDNIDVVLSLSNINSAVSLDWDYPSLSIFWSDVTNDTINRADWDGVKQTVIAGQPMDSPSGLSVDWIGHNVYWSDSGRNTIEVALYDGGIRSVVIWSGLDRPRDVVVDSMVSLMFWIHREGTNSKIEKSGMDGGERKVILSHNLTWPHGMTLDLYERRLYWSDIGAKTIESSDYDGKYRFTLISGHVKNPFGLAIHDRYLYWTDWELKTIQKTDKMRGEDSKILLKGLDNLMDIQVFHSHRPNRSSPCSGSPCQQLCLLSPTVPGFRCACSTGLALGSDKRSCATDMVKFLITASRTSIRRMSLDVPYYADVVVPTTGVNLSNALVLDIYPPEATVFWSDTDTDTIYRARYDISGTSGEKSIVEEVISIGLGDVNGIAVDWIGGKLYWTDAGRKRIEVSNLDGSSRKSLIWTDLDSPRAIVLHYSSGYMFWTDWGSVTRISRADMDGSRRALLLDSGLGWINGLAVYQSTTSGGAKLLWVDSQLHTLEMADINGANRKVLLSNLPAPYGITVIGDEIYWTDWETRSIHRVIGEDPRTSTILLSGLTNIADLTGIDMKSLEAKKQTDVCKANNAGCSHLCLRNSWGYSCACPTGYQLLSDKKTCSSNLTAFLLFASKKSLRRIALNTEVNTFADVYLPITDVTNAVAIDFDYQDRMIFFSDISLHLIRRTDFDGTKVTNVISSDLVRPDGLAFDWVANNLYWSDTGRNVIEVCRADGSSRRIIIDLNLDEPRALALYPKKGFLFWTDWGKSPKIERSFLDGSARTSLITSDLGWPNGITVDYEVDQIYWVDAQLDRIEASDFEGSSRRTIIKDISHPFGLTIYGPHVYWTDWQIKAIERSDKDGKRSAKELIVDNIEYLMEIKMVAPSRQPGTNPCGIGNGGCTHLCLFRPQGYICACPTVQDSRPCSQVPGDILNLESSSTVSTSKKGNPINGNGNLPENQDYDDNKKHNRNEIGSKECSGNGTSSSSSNSGCLSLGISLDDPFLQMAYIATAAALLLLTLLLASIGLIIVKRKYSSNVSSEDARSSTSEIIDKVYPPICNQSLPHPTLYSQAIESNVNRGTTRSPNLITPPSPQLINQNISDIYHQSHRIQQQQQFYSSHHITGDLHSQHEQNTSFETGDDDDDDDDNNNNTNNDEQYQQQSHRGLNHQESIEMSPQRGYNLLNQEIYSEDEKIGFNSSFESYPSYKNWDEPGILLSIPDLTASSTPRKIMFGGGGERPIDGRSETFESRGGFVGSGGGGGGSVIPFMMGSNRNNNINFNNKHNHNESNNINYSTAMRRSISSIHSSNLPLPPPPHHHQQQQLQQQHESTRQPPFTLNIIPTPYHIFQSLPQSGDHQNRINYDKKNISNDIRRGKTKNQQQAHSQQNQYLHHHTQQNQQQQQQRQQRQQNRRKFKFNSLHASPVTKRSFSPHPLYRHPSFHSIETDI